MFHKTLIALATGALAAGSAFAADVTLYGTVDTGVVYSNNKFEVNGHKAEKKDSFSMESGTNSATAFGLKGSEKLGNGLEVGFVLENGFESDSGEFTTAGKLFDREASLAVKGGFGSLYAGRMGALISDTGSVGFYGRSASPFGTGWSSNIAGHSAVMANFATRRDNTLTYVSPEFAGTTFYAQYAMGDNGKENKPSSDRYGAIGVKWTQGPLEVAALVDHTNKDSSKIQGSEQSVDDAMTYNLAAGYDCGFAKTTIALQYFKDAADAGSIYGTFDKSKVLNKYSTMTGYGVHLGSSFDALGGTVYTGLGYMDADADIEQQRAMDAKVYTASLGYQYNLSARTSVYTGAGYVQRELEGNKIKLETKGFDVAAGLVHKF